MPKLAKFAIATIAFTRHGHGWAREGKEGGIGRVLQGWLFSRKGSTTPPAEVKALCYLSYSVTEGDWTESTASGRPVLPSTCTPKQLTKINLS